MVAGTGTSHRPGQAGTGTRLRLSPPSPRSRSGRLWEGWSCRKTSRKRPLCPSLGLFWVGFLCLELWGFLFWFLHYFYFSHVFGRGRSVFYVYNFFYFKILSKHFPLPEPFFGFIYIPIIHNSIPDLDSDTWLTRSKVDPVQPVCQTKPLIHQLKSFHCRVMKESRTVFHSFLPMSLLTPETKTLLGLSAPPLPHPREFSSWHSPAEKAKGFKTEILQNRIHGIKQ